MRTIKVEIVLVVPDTSGLITEYKIDRVAYHVRRAINVNTGYMVESINVTRGENDNAKG